MRGIAAFVIVTGLSACAPQVPDSGAGVGFQNYNEYQQRRAERDRTLAGSGTVATVQTAPSGSSAAAPAATSAAPAVSTGGARPRGAPPSAAATAAGAPSGQGAGISDEQNFSAVAARETIESDRQRIMAQREQYQVIQPKPVPQRTASSGPNIVQFALSTTHQPGTPMFRRSRWVTAASNQRNCAKYGSADIAQEALLSNGGPQKDRENLDPDGDGFACGWDPSPFRRAVNR